MPETDSTTNENTTDDSIISEDSNPFGDTKSASDIYSSFMNDDGEIEFEKKEEVKEESKDKESDDKETIDESENLVNNLFKEPDPKLEAIEKETKEVKNKLSKIEKKEATKKALIALNKEKEEYRKQLEESDFTEGQIEFLVKDKFEEKEEKLLKGEDEEEEEKQEGLTKEQQKQLKRETNEVIKKYDGAKAPHYKQLEPHVAYLVHHFEEDLGNLSLTSAMRVAENVPFMSYLENYDETKEQINALKDENGKFTKIGLKEFLQLTENFRVQYYKQKGKDPQESYDHLFPPKKEEKEENKNNDLTNEDIERLTKEKKAGNMSVPGGEVETGDGNKKPKDALDAVERAFSQM